MSLKPVSIPGTFGFGTMSLTWTPNPKPFEEAFESIKYSMDKYNIRFLNGGDFYGPDNINLKLLLEFWKKYAKDYPDLVISIKGAINPTTLAPDGSKESISKSVENMISFFPKEKSKRPVLIFEIARVDTNVPYEETIGYIKEYVETGAIDGISLSEVGVGSIAKAVKVAPISCVEVEVSLMCQDVFENGVLKELSEKQIPIVAYSPLCRGFLTDRTANDLDAFFKLCQTPGDIRGHLDRFSAENFPTNLKVVKKLQEFAHSKNTTLESLALSWLVSVSEQEDYEGIKKVCKIIPIPSGSTADKIDKNLGNINKLSKADLKEIKNITDTNKVVGYRYNKHAEHMNFA